MSQRFSGVIGGSASSASSPTTRLYVDGGPTTHTISNPRSVSPDSATAVPFEMTLEAQGLTSSAVQLGILQGRLRTAQSELQRARVDLKENAERIGSLSQKLNEQKLQNGTLTTKYGALLSKLTTAEASQRQLEDSLVAERNGHRATRELIESARSQAQQREEALAYQVQQLEARLAKAQAAADAQLSQDRGGQNGGARDMLLLQERHQRALEGLHAHCLDALTRLDNTSEEDESSIFVVRSAAQSMASELEGRLTHAEALLQTLTDGFSYLNGELEDETTKFAVGLLSENKELWSSLSRLQLELDQVRSDLAVAQRKVQDAVSGGAFREQLEYLTQQNHQLEETVRSCRVTIDAQTAKERELEDATRRVIDEMKLLQQRLDSAIQDRNGIQKSLDEARRVADENASEVTAARAEADDFRRANATLKSRLDQLPEQLRAEREARLGEMLSQVRAMQAERDEALHELEVQRATMSELRAKAVANEKELDSRAQVIERQQRALEANHAQFTRTLQDEIGSQRALLENELEEVRHRLAERDADHQAAVRDLDAARAEAQSLQARHKLLEDQVLLLRSERDEVQAAHAAAVEKTRAMVAERDGAHAVGQQADQRAAHLEAELARMRNELERLRAMHDGDRQRLQGQIQALESELAESERQRMVVVEETRTARTTRAVDETAVKTLKEKYDRDREQMMAENLRLQEQFAEAQRVGAQYQSVIAQMRQQKPSNTHLLSQIDELNRRLDDASAVKRQLDDASRENRRLAEDNQRLLHEKEEMADKVRFFLEEQNNAAKKELDMERVFREATSQVRRLDAQLGEVESVARSIGGSAGVGSAGTTSLAMSSSMRRGVASATPQTSVTGVTGGTGAPWRP